MRWLCFLLLASSAAAQSSGTKPLQFDLTAIPATRDSFVFAFRGAERGWAVWQYEIRPLEMTQEVLYTAASEFLLDRSELGRRGVQHLLGHLERSGSMRSGRSR